MRNLVIALVTDTPSPASPTLRPGLTEDQVSPGFLGFLTVFLLALAVVFLIRSMNKRIRRVRYRAQVLEEQAADAAGGVAGQAARRPRPAGAHAPDLEVDDGPDTRERP